MMVIEDYMSSSQVAQSTFARSVHKTFDPVLASSKFHPTLSFASTAPLSSSTSSPYSSYSPYSPYSTHRLPFSVLTTPPISTAGLDAEFNPFFFCDNNNNNNNNNKYSSPASEEEEKYPDVFDSDFLERIFPDSSVVPASPDSNYFSDFSPRPSPDADRVKTAFNNEPEKDARRYRLDASTAAAAAAKFEERSDYLTRLISSSSSFVGDHGLDGGALLKTGNSCDFDLRRVDDVVDVKREPRESDEYLIEMLPLDFFETLAGGEDKLRASNVCNASNRRDKDDRTNDDAFESLFLNKEMEQEMLNMFAHLFGYKYK